MSKQPTTVCETHDRGLPAGVRELPGRTGRSDGRREISQGRDKRGGRRLEGPPGRPRQTGVSHTAPRDFKAGCGHGRPGAQEPYQDWEEPPFGMGPAHGIACAL